MKWFWYSLIGFILLMCSCRSKKVATQRLQQLQVQSEASYLNESVKIDTSKTAYFANEIQRIVIEEVITETEYDKESGKPTKETKTERKVIQDTDKVFATEKNKGQSEVKNDSLNHIVEKHEMVDAEAEEEKTGGQESFGKYLGIIVGLSIVILILFLFLKNKSRISKLFRSS